jgi:hypothetical protein
LIVWKICTTRSSGECYDFKDIPKKLKHIKGLKDLIIIHLTHIPGVNLDDETTGAKFQCPITGQEFNGKFKFYARPKCGHVLSAQAMKEVDSTSCAVCHTPFTDADKIPINGNEEVKMRGTPSAGLRSVDS